MLNLNKVLFTGDSLVDDQMQTWQLNWRTDYGIDSEFCWTHLIGNMLGCEWFNSAIGGSQMNVFKDDLENRIFKYSPSLVIMDGGACDVWMSPADYTATQTISALDYIFEQILSRGIQLVFVVFPNYYDATFTEVPLLYASYPTLINKYKGLYPDDFFAINLNGTVLGTASSDISDTPAKYRISDMVHFNKPAQLKCAELIWQALITFDTTINKAIKGSPVTLGTRISGAGEVQDASVISWSGIANGDTVTDTLDTSNATMTGDITVKDGFVTLGGE